MTLFYPVNGFRVSHHWAVGFFVYTGLLLLVAWLWFSSLMLFSPSCHRNVFSRKRQTTQRCESTGREICASQAAITVAADGTSPLTVQSARLRPPLMV